MNKKKYRHLLTATALLLSLSTACTQVTDELQEKESGENTLQLSSLSLVQDPQATPRVVTTQSLSAIRLYATDNTASHNTYTGAAGSNSKGYADFTRSGNNWILSATGNKIVIDTNNPPVIHAFYPSTLEVTNAGGNTHTVPVDIKASNNFTGGEQTDYLYAPPVTMDKGAKTVAVTLKHALAKVSFRIEKAGNVTETVTVTRVEILSKSNGLHMGSNIPMSLDNGSLDGLISTASLSLTGGSTLTENLSSPNITCLVAPTRLPADDLSFRLTISGQSEPLTTAPVRTAQTWEAGRHYVYHITVNKLEAGFSGMKVYDWQSDANQDTSIGI